MKGSLRGKSPGTQLLILISICVGSLFTLGGILSLLATYISHVPLSLASNPSKWNPNDPRIIEYIRGAQIAQFIALFIIPTSICAYLFSENPKQYLGLKQPYNNFYWIIGILAMLIALPFTNWLGLINKNIHFSQGIEQWLRRSEDDNNKIVAVLLTPHTIKDLVINVIVIAGLAGIGEELLFRGLLQRLLIRIFKSPWAGIIVTAFIFSAFHLEFYGFLPRFALGIILGVIYWYSGSLWAAMLGHFVYDGLIVIVAYYYPAAVNDDQTTQIPNLVLYGLVSLAAVAALVTWMVKRSRSTFQTVYADDMLPVRDNPFSF